MTEMSRVLKILIWVGIAAVAAVAVFVVLRVVGFVGGGPSQTSPQSDAPPPDVVTVTTAPTTTTVPVVTTTQPTVQVFGQGSPADEAEEAEEAESPEQSGADRASGPDSPTTSQGVAPPPSNIETQVIGDAGDFTAHMTLECVDYGVQLTWNVLPPFEETEQGRVRTAAPLDAGDLRVYFETFVPPDVDPDEAPDEASEDETTAEPDEAEAADGAADDAPSDGDAEDEATPAPDEAADGAADDAPSDGGAEDEATPVPESVLVLDASGISGRGTDLEGNGELTGVLRHGCPSASRQEAADWTLTVETHREIAWEITLLPRSDISSGGDEAAGFAVGNAGDIIDQIVGGEGASGAEQ